MSRIKIKHFGPVKEGNLKEGGWLEIKKLLEFNNMNAGNKLILTTHSPYIINFLNLAIHGEYLETRIEKSNQANALKSKLYQIIPEQSLICSNNVIVYQCNEVDGSINKLPTPEGIPSDQNYLNDMLKEGNRMFDKLLEIEEEL